MSKYIERILRTISFTSMYVERPWSSLSCAFKYIGRSLSCGFAFDCARMNLYSTYLWYIGVPLLEKKYPIIYEPIYNPYIVIDQEQHTEILLTHI